MSAVDSGMTPDPEQIARALESMRQVLTGTGEHAEHTREQVGRCVYCSCGMRAQGRMGAAASRSTRTWQVRLDDGFVCWKGTDEDYGRRLAIRHPGATLEYGDGPMA